MKLDTLQMPLPAPLESPEGNLATLVFVKQFLGHTEMRTKIDAQGPQIEMSIQW